MKHVAFAIAIAIAAVFSATAAEPDPQSSAQPKSNAQPNTQPEPTSLYVTNTIGQELFVARLVAVQTTRHRRFKWAMTFERVTDGARFYFEVLDNSPIANALGFRVWEDGQGDVSERVAAAPRVVLITEPYKFYEPLQDFEPSDYGVVGCFPIDETLPNQRLQLTSDAGDAAD